MSHVRAPSREAVAWTVNAAARWNTRRALRRSLINLPQVVYEWQRRASERHHLRQLDDRMLKDIGLSRADVGGEVAKPFWTA